MTTIIKVDVLFNIPEERELAKQFKKSNPDFLELKTSRSDGVHFRYTEIQVGKKEHNEVDPKMFYGVYEKEKQNEAD